MGDCFSFFELGKFIHIFLFDYNRCISSHMPPMGPRKGAVGINFIGIGVFSVTENVKFVRSLTKATLI